MGKAFEKEKKNVLHLFVEDVSANKVEPGRANLFGKY
jgi:hypothetical protein